MLADYAHDICGKEVSKNWAQKFVERHPDLKVNEIITATTTTTTTTPVASEDPLSSASGAQAHSAVPPEPIPQFAISGMPPPLGPKASYNNLHSQNDHLRLLLEWSRIKLKKAYAIQKLMERENEWLHMVAFHKDKSKKKKTYSSLEAHHMTSEETMDELAKMEFMTKWKDVMKEAGQHFKIQRQMIVQHEREVEEQQCKAEAKRVEKAAKAAAQEVEQALKAMKKQGKKGRKATKKKSTQDHDTFMEDLNIPLPDSHPSTPSSELSFLLSFSDPETSGVVNEESAEEISTSHCRNPRRAVLTK
ncbi:hypothetical protein D9756_011375 [Leucocoprinus leucothites]|uniref:HTH CENPB-type domain-containing protein n=1 Tax=Leucocoprinus leucothites TaxID=201217 RepID=A0A8H5CR05_9AGAR|nr:hypothetical protein D9756_011375 [Leucoagaricus leucothites]